MKFAKPIQITVECTISVSRDLFPRTKSWRRVSEATGTTLYAEAQLVTACFFFVGPRGFDVVEDKAAGLPDSAAAKGQSKPLLGSLAGRLCFDP